MARISGTWYIVIGLFLAITSFIVWKVNDTRRPVMIMFFFIGVIFCLIGAFKLYSEKGMPAQQPQPAAHQNAQHPMHVHPQQMQRPPQHYAQQGYAYHSQHAPQQQYRTQAPHHMQQGQRPYQHPAQQGPQHPQQGVQRR